MFDDTRHVGLDRILGWEPFRHRTRNPENNFDLPRIAVSRPILTLGFLLNHLDRNNIGFAALQMNREIGLTATQFGIGAGILFLGYCFFESPSNLLLYRAGARVWLS